MLVSTLDIARLQFAITITFHIIFPSLSIGLASYIVIMEGLWLLTKKKFYYQTCRFWGKILALTFGMGIISGLAMEFQLGTNWGGFSKIAGPVLGVLFVSETLTAFFIEATFLGFMILGWEKINKYFHYFSTLMVWIGVMLSAFWILVANSWMQTPSGVMFINNTFSVTSWLQVIFNPTTTIRYCHMILASYIATLMVITGVSCYYRMKKRFDQFSKVNLKMAIIFLSVLLPIQSIVGDEVGLKVHHFQPIKTAAIEGLWKTENGAPLLLFADIDQKNQRNKFAIAIPHLASIINTHQWNGTLTGLITVSKKYQPNVMVVFYSFRIMVGLGITLMFFSWLCLYRLLRKKLYHSIWLMRIGLFLSPMGLIALISGWYTAEEGRQPWVVYHLLSTVNASTNVPFSKIVIGFFLILLIYGIIFGFFYNYYFILTIKKGPHIENYNEKNRKFFFPHSGNLIKKIYEVKKWLNIYRGRRI